jgi:hypothetical protein
MKDGALTDAATASISDDCNGVTAEDPEAVLAQIAIVSS